MPEMNQENNLNVENNVTPVVPNEPVSPVVDIVQEPVVNVEPAVEIPTVEVKEEVVEIADAPVVEITPAEIPAPVAPEPVMVNEIPEVLPAENVAVEESVVTVTPETPVAPVEEVPVPEVAPVAEMPVVETLPVVETVPVEEAQPVAEPLPVVETVPVEEVAPVVDTVPVIETEAEVSDDIPVIETAPAVEETPVAEATPEVAPVAPTPAPTSEAPAAPSNDDNSIINSVVSDVTPTETPATPEANGTAPAATEGETGKKGNKKVLLVAILGVLAILLGGLLAFYFFVYTKPEFLFKSSLNVLKTQLTKNEEITGPMQMDLSFQTNINSNDEMFKPIFDNINKLYFETSIYLDLENKVEFMKLDSKYKDQAFINADMFVEKENAYLKLNGIFEKYIKVVLEEDIFKEDETDQDAIVVAESFIEALENSLKNEYFTKVKKTIPLNNVVKEVTANTLVINGGNVIPFLTSIVNELTANDAFLTAFANMEGIDKNVLKDTLNDFVGDIQETPAEILSTINYQLSFYTEGLLNKLVGVGIVYEDKAYDLYFFEQHVSVFTTIENSTELLLEAYAEGEKYVVNAFVGEDTYSVTIGLKVTENPQFTKPDVSNFVESEKLTEEDSMTIMGGIMQSPGVTTFMTDFQDIIALIQMMMGGNSTQPDMDFDTDMDMDFDMDMGDGTIYLE